MHKVGGGLSPKSAPLSACHLAEGQTMTSLFAHFDQKKKSLSDQ